MEGAMSGGGSGDDRSRRCRGVCPAFSSVRAPPFWPASMGRHRVWARKGVSRIGRARWCSWRAGRRFGGGAPILPLARPARATWRSCSRNEDGDNTDGRLLVELSTPPPERMQVTLRSLGGRRRQIAGSLRVAAPMEPVWRSLTSFAEMHTFVPHILESRYDTEQQLLEQVAVRMARYVSGHAGRQPLDAAGIRAERGADAAVSGGAGGAQDPQRGAAGAAGVL
eukprot:ctg_336.g176